MDIVTYKIILFSVRAVKHSHLYRENKQKIDGIDHHTVCQSDWSFSLGVARYDTAFEAELRGDIASVTTGATLNALPMKYDSRESYDSRERYVSIEGYVSIECYDSREKFTFRGKRYVF